MRALACFERAIVESKVEESSTRWVPRVGGGVGFSEERSLGEIADIKGIFVLENVEIVVILVFENY